MLLILLMGMNQITLLTYGALHLHLRRMAKSAYRIFPGANGWSPILAISLMPTRAKNAWQFVNDAGQKELLVYLGGNYVPQRRRLASLPGETAGKYAVTLLEGLTPSLA